MGLPKLNWTRFALITLLFGIVRTQDSQNFFFPSPPASQGRFVPSSFQSNNRHHGFLGSRNSINAAAPPGSYQEQLIFIGNEATAAPQNQLTSSFSSFPQFPSTRSPDYYDISPRPFGIPGSSQTFSRAQSLRPNAGSGFVPKTQQPSRTNVPHQQGQFLAHFNEQGHLSTDKASATSSSSTPVIGHPQSNRLGRPFGSTGGSLNRNRPVVGNKQQDDLYPSQQQLPFRNTRNRFQPSAERTTPTTTTSTTTEKPRYNRFGASRSNPPPPPPPPAPSAKSRLPSNKTVFQPRRPVFISREVNEPVHTKGRPFGGRVAINQDPIAEVVDPEEEIHEQNHVSHEETKTAADEPLFEKLQLHEAERTPVQTQQATATTAAPSSSPVTTQPSVEQEEHTVILTDNFYLPENEKKDLSRDHYDEVVTTPRTVEYEYEYEEDYEDKTATVPTTVDTKVEVSTAVEESPTPTESKEETTTALLKEDEHGSGHSEEGSADYEEEEEEDEEEYEDETTDPRPETSSSSSSPTSTTTTEFQDHREDVLGKQIVSVVTTKSVINGSTAYPQPVTPSTTPSDEDHIYLENKVTPAKESDPSELEIEDPSMNNATESYVVIASIQPSRSINGARFLPFPAIEQEETKQTLSELERKIHEQRKVAKSNEKEDVSEAVPSSTTEKPLPSQSTESIIDKLDRVQSELSSGLLTGKFPIISAMPELDAATAQTSTTTGTKFAPINIRKFMPKTSTTPKPKIHIEDLPMDDLTGLLPPGFKPRASFKNKKLSTTTTTAEPPSIQGEKKPARNSTISRSFKNSPVEQEISLAGLLPKGFKLNQTAEPAPPIPKDILSKIKFEDSLEKFLPKDYKEKAATTAKPPVTFVDDISRFLPPGFRAPFTPTKKPQRPAADDLPPGFKAEATTKKPAIGSIPIADDISKFLPPGFKLDSKEKEADTFDISKFLPKDYKPAQKEEEKETLFKKIETKDISELLPPGYKAEKTPAEPASTTPATDSSYKVVFPKGLNRRPGQRVTTPRPHSAEGPPPPAINIKKGPPMRATTEFTGWPTPSTTPISIEKLLEQAQSIDISELLPKALSTTTTTTTTTTTPEPPRPTQPGTCHADCDLAGTIKIIDGVNWKPELLDHNTAEWKNLAREVEAQLNEVYSNAPQLSNWYKKVRIDSFSKGSVLVDYFVELSNITRDVNTLEIKKLFHTALTQPPLPVVPLNEDTENETDSEDEGISYREGKGEKLVKDTYLLGKFVVDPMSTDFIVIPKSLSPTVEFAEEDVLIPQWAIALIVIGVGSLCFVIIFGVAVLLNRQNRAKKTPTPLSADMLNELNKNHMGGADNYGVDEFYNIDDAWNDTKQPIKPKRFTNSMHGSSASNIYDSWRSTRHGDYYYDSHNYTPHQKVDPYPPDVYTDAHQMYTYNHRARYQRDYDPDF